MRKVYICHPFSDDPTRNKARAAKIVKGITEAQDEQVQRMSYRDSAKYEFSGIHPLSPLAMFPDGIEICRQTAMNFCMSLLYCCDELWVCSDHLTDGMKDEIEFASKNKIPVKFKKEFEK